MDGLPNDRPQNARPLSLVIPAYNEEAVIAQAVAEADEALTRLGGDYEILVVDDGSDDRTAAIVAEAARYRPRVRLLRHAANRGYSAALRTGFEAARLALVAFTDADCQFDLADLGSLLALADRFPLVVGYRVDRQDPALRRFASWGYNVLVRGLLGTRVRDCDCALKVFRRKMLANLLPETDGFFVNTEMLARARQLGYEVAEVGVRHRPRQAGQSKVSLGDVPRTLRTLLPFWWSRVLFPGPALAEADRGRSMRQTAGLLTILMAVAGLLFFARLTCPLQEPEEARYAEIPRQMLDQGEFIIPVYHGQPYYHKPPLLYWLVMGSYQVFGVHDWAARLVPATAGLLIVLVTFLWGLRTIGPRGAFAGALILALSARFIYFGRMLTLESLLALWVVSALAAVYLSMQGPKFRPGWWLLGAILAGLGVLTKGPVALVLILMPVVSLQVLDTRMCRPGSRWWLAFGVMAVGVASPWYVLVTCTDPSFLRTFFWTHHIIRFLAPYDHVKPVWFYLPGLLVGMMPWSLLLPFLARFLGQRSGATAQKRPPALGFFLLAFGTCLLFFSASACKRSGYLLPAFAPLTLALGCYVDARLPRPALGLTAASRGAAQLATALTLLALMMGMAAGLLAVAANIWKPALGLGLVCLAVLAAGAVLWSGRKRSARAACGLCAVTAFVLLFVGVHDLLPGYARKFSLRGQVRRYVSLVGDRRLPILCYPHRWDSVSFYLDRDDVRVYTPRLRRQLVAYLESQPRTLVFVKTDRPGEKPMSELLRALPPALEFLPRGRVGTVTAGIIRRRAGTSDFLFALGSTPGHSWEESSGSSAK